MTANVATTMTAEEMTAMIARLQAENAKLKTANQGKLSCKVSEKGAVCVYGLGRFPVTLYASQWTRLLDFAVAIRAFIETNQDKLATKDKAE